MPPCCPLLRNAEVFARFVPAHFIGGDLYDFVSYSRDPKKASRTGISIGDVSGKGAPAAIYAALVSGFLRSHASAEPGAAVMLQKINGSLNERPIDAQYVSMIYALWDDQRRQLRIANSGLPRPIYCHNGNVEVVQAAGLPMGLFMNAEYDEVTYNAHEGDLFVFFSDGIVDASDERGTMFGRAAIEAVVAANHDRSAEEVVNAIFDAVGKHTAAAEPFDDQTVVAIRVRDKAPKKNA
jgi:sigma-B regulation protein RsbU (phosphoserine phosphatase)